MKTIPDPAELAIFNALFAAVAEEMGLTLGRTAHSPNIKERRDYSCAVFDPQGRLVAQAAHIPVHLGAMPSAVQAAMGLAPFAPGDVVMLNDPYLGGTHLPDITMVSPVFVTSSRRRRPAGFVASRAHHADVGGMSPGSLPLSTELYQEGVIIPPVRLVDAGQRNEGVLALITANSHAPAERLGDLEAQLAAQRVGERRLLALVATHGEHRVQEHAEALMDLLGDPELGSSAALALAREQEMKAEVAQKRALVVLAEAEVPKAMAAAFREGNLEGSAGDGSRT